MPARPREVSWGESPAVEVTPPERPPDGPGPTPDARQNEQGKEREGEAEEETQHRISPVAGYRRNTPLTPPEISVVRFVRTWGRASPPGQAR